LPQKLLSILSAHKGAGAIKSARHMDKNSKKSNPFQSARTTEHRRLKLTVNVNNGSATTTMPTSRRPDFVLDKVFERIQAPEGHHTSPEPEAAVTTHQDPAEYHGQGFEQGTSSENPDLPKPPTPPTPHTPPTTISQQSIIETNIQMSSEQEPIDKEGAHKKLPKESTRKTLFGHQPEADPIQKIDMDDDHINHYINPPLKAVSLDPPPRDNSQHTLLKDEKTNDDDQHRLLKDEKTNDDDQRLQNSNPGWLDKDIIITSL
ncbi:hypothetical protein Tco_0862150, partial [Tanacetum coccineum]